MVRCGHCLKAFDTRANFAPKEIDPQLELPLLDESMEEAELPPLERLTSPAPDSSSEAVLLPFTLTEHTVFTPDENALQLARRRSKFWISASFGLLILLLAQAVYLFRVELAARHPSLKPALVRYCQFLKCSVPLPQKISLMSIESSELNDDPALRNHIFLNALLRNRAAFAQAFPNLELTLTDGHDSALARKTFSPGDYIDSPEQLITGLPSNQEFSVKLHLDTTDLKPVGYRLVLYYPGYQLR